MAASRRKGTKRTIPTNLKGRVFATGRSSRVATQADIRARIRELEQFTLDTTDRIVEEAGIALDEAVDRIQAKYDADLLAFKRYSILRAVAIGTNSVRAIEADYPELVPDRDGSRLPTIEAIVKAERAVYVTRYSHRLVLAKTDWEAVRTGYKRADKFQAIVESEPLPSQRYWVYDLGISGTVRQVTHQDLVGMDDREIGMWAVVSHQIAQKVLSGNYTPPRGVMYLSWEHKLRGLFVHDPSANRFVKPIAFSSSRTFHKAYQLHSERYGMKPLWWAEGDFDDVKEAGERYGLTHRFPRTGPFARGDSCDDQADTA